MNHILFWLLILHLIILYNLEKKFNTLRKITLTDWHKVVNDIKHNRLAAKISALSSCEWEKYEYLNGGDLGYKTDAVEKANFDYSPLG